MADDTKNQLDPQHGSPDTALLLRGADDDDSRYVTEKLEKMKPLTHRLLALWLITLGVASVLTLIQTWPVSPTVEQLKSKADSLSRKMTTLSNVLNASPADSALKNAKLIVDQAKNYSIQASKEETEAQSRSYFLIALFSGVLGGVLHGLSSLMDFRGQRRLFRSWALWYFGLPVVGGLLSLIFFFLLRAGLFPAASSVEVVSPYGIAAIGAVCGMFTDKATVKLSEVLDTLFSSQSKAREGKLGGKVTSAAGDTPEKPGNK